MALRVRVRVPAKINLHLQVLGPRPDGYWELRSLLQSVDLRDELVVETAADGIMSLEVEPPGSAPTGQDNLVMRAAQALWRVAGDRPGAHIRLVKRIPAGAGLGGGSADATAALVALDALWGLELGNEGLYSCARELGSDVPFFLHGGLALGVGRGDEVYPLPDLAELGVVLVHPGLEIATAEVFGRLDRLTWDLHEAKVYAFSAGFAEQLRWEILENHLQPVVLEGWPEVADALAAVRATGPLHAAVTGSGASVFGLYESRSAAREAASVVAGRWQVDVGVTLGRDRSRPLAESLEAAP